MDDEYNNLATVEVYDQAADEWEFMGGMTSQRSGHGLVATGSKMFAVWGSFDASVDVFDVFCGRFVAVTSPFQSDYFGAVCMRGDVFVFYQNSRRLLRYDVGKKSWREEAVYETTDNMNYYVKIPKLKAWFQ